VQLIIAQRLARKLCSFCKRPDDVPRAELLREGFTNAEIDSESFRIYRAVGCEQCNDGYKGRTGIYQVMPISDSIGRIIMEGGNTRQVAEKAREEGIADLRQSGLRKVREGAIDLLEVNRVTND